MQPPPATRPTDLRYRLADGPNQTMFTSATNHTGSRFSAATECKPEKNALVPLVRKPEVGALIVWLVACSAVVFSRTLRLPYALDDLDHLHAVTTFRSGQISPSTFFLLNHNEHILPMLRLYFLVATRISGLDAWALHVMMFLTYVAGAIGCAWIFFSLTRSRLGAFLAGTIYASAGGFAGSIVWLSNQFSMSGTALIYAMAVLVSPYARRRWSIVPVLALVLVAATGLGASAVAALSIPAYLYLAKPESIPLGKRNLMIGASLLLSIAILLAIRWIMALQGMSHALTFTGAGVSAGVFLILTAPGRFLLAWVPAGELGLPLDLAASSVGWILLAATLRWLTKPMRVLLAALWIADCLLVLLIGLGRYRDTYLELFFTDRYYFFFLLPLTLQAAAVLERAAVRTLRDGSRFRKAVVACALGCILPAFLAMAHSRLDQNMPWAVFKDSKRSLQEAKVLAKILASEAAKEDLHLADGPLRFPGVHKEHIALSCIVFTQFPHGLPGVSWNFSRNPQTSVEWPWNVPPISDTDAAVENQILDKWGRIEKRRPYSCVIGGQIRDIADPGILSCADAANASGTAGIKLR